MNYDFVLERILRIFLKKNSKHRFCGEWPVAGVKEGIAAPKKVFILKTMLPAIEYFCGMEIAYI